MDKLDKLKLASSSFGERLKTGGAQMSRIVSSKMKEILQAPTPESKIVDEATSETMEEPNWGLNLRICAMINGEELNGTEIVKAIKKKLSGKNPASQRLSLDLLEACTSNCEKVFSEVASEKVLDDMVRMIDDPKTDHENRAKALQLIRAWGESEELAYLPAFRQTYTSLQTRQAPPVSGNQNGSPRELQYPFASFVNQEPISPPEMYPVPHIDLNSLDRATYPRDFGSQSEEGNKELLVVARNSVDLLSDILNSGIEPKPIKDDLTLSLLDKCKRSLSTVQRIAETTTDDEAMLFEALNLHDELQRVISKYEEIESGPNSQEQPAVTPTTVEELNSSLQVSNLGETEKDKSSPKIENSESGSETKKEESLEKEEHGL